MQSKAFIDEERAPRGPVAVAGFDPDLHQSALVRIISDGSTVDTVQVFLFEVNKSVRGLHAANEMCRRISDEGILFEAEKAIVEGQQHYPDYGASRELLVAKANDLIHLGHVTGAATAAFHANGCEDATIHRPSQWKAQRKKVNMHREAMEMVGTGSFGTRYQTFDRSELPSVGIHAMDALCMALKGAGFRV